MNYVDLAAAIVAAVILEKLFEAVFGPLWKATGWPNLYKLYAGMVIGTAVGFATGLNAAPVFAMSPWVGRSITALLIGVGPSILYDLLDKVPQPKPPA